jgi:hypothetical protein
MQVRFRTAREQIRERVEVLAWQLDLPQDPTSQEFDTGKCINDLRKPLS